MATRTSPGPACGSGRSSSVSTSGPPCARSATAFMSIALAVAVRDAGDRTAHHVGGAHPGRRIAAVVDGARGERELKIHADHLAQRRAGGRHAARPGGAVRMDEAEWPALEHIDEADAGGARLARITDEGRTLKLQRRAGAARRDRVLRGGDALLQRTPVYGRHRTVLTCRTTGLRLR